MGVAILNFWNIIAVIVTIRARLLIYTLFSSPFHKISTFQLALWTAWSLRVLIQAKFFIDNLVHDLYISNIDIYTRGLWSVLNLKGVWERSALYFWCQELSLPLLTPTKLHVSFKLFYVLYSSMWKSLKFIEKLSTIFRICAKLHC